MKEEKLKRVECTCSICGVKFIVYGKFGYHPGYCEKCFDYLYNGRLEKK